jgi:hypothetical protein
MVVRPSLALRVSLDFEAMEVCPSLRVSLSGFGTGDLNGRESVET